MNGHSFDVTPRRSLPSMYRNSGGTYPARPIDMEKNDGDAQQEFSVQLCSALLKSAVDDALYLVPGISLRDAETARIWILSKFQEKPSITFEDCCATLHCDPETVRAGIIQQAKAKGINL